MFEEKNRSVKVQEICMTYAWLLHAVQCSYKTDEFRDIENCKDLGNVDIVLNSMTHCVNGSEVIVYAAEFMH